MLVLSRTLQEAVMIGGTDGFERQFKVTVLEIEGLRVKLGFEVDGNIPVHRMEVYERIVVGRRANNPIGGPAAPVD